MKILKGLLVSSLLLLHTSLCFAQDTINVSLIIDPILPCSQPIIDVAVTQKDTLGIFPGSCSADRPSGLSGTNANTHNQFDRLGFNWRYAFNGVFKDGFYVGAATAIEHDNFSTTAGSTADVYFSANGLITGYQWFWKNGFNISWNFSAAHLTRISLDNYYIAPTESADVINWLNTNASSGTHFSMGPFLGWAF